jgi:hypothetical protein
MVVKRLTLVLLPLCALAQDARLTATRKTVLEMRQYANQHQEVRGGIPQATVAKHEIRNWIEARLARFPQDGDVAVLIETLHNGLSQAKLFCDKGSDCFPTALGFLDEIQIEQQGDFLIAQTAVGVGICCGYDYSAYI